MMVTGKVAAAATGDLLGVVEAVRCVVVLGHFTGRHEGMSVLWTTVILFVCSWISLWLEPGWER